MYALNLAEDNRVLSVSFVNQFTPADQLRVEELPEGDVSDYLYVDGGYIYEPLPKPEPPTPVEEVSCDELAAAIAEGVNDAN